MVLKCSHSRSHIIDSRPSEQGTYRRHICMICNTKWSTYGVPKERLAELLKAEKELNQMKDLLK